MVSGTLSGLIAVPAWHAVNSGIAGTAIFVGQGVIVPASGLAWNSVVSPTLALVGGPQPTSERADGFWVRPVQNELTQEELAAALAWGMKLRTEVQPYFDRADDVSLETHRKVEAIQNEGRAREKDLRDQANQRVLDLRSGTGTLPSDSSYVHFREAQIRNALKQNTELSSSEVEGVIRLLKKYPPSLIPAYAPDRDKTDPVRRSIEILEEIE